MEPRWPSINRGAIGPEIRDGFPLLQPFNTFVIFFERELIQSTTVRFEIYIDLTKRRKVSRDVYAKL